MDVKPDCLKIADRLTTSVAKTGAVDHGKRRRDVLMPLVRHSARNLHAARKMSAARLWEN